MQVIDQSSGCEGKVGEEGKREIHNGRRCSALSCCVTAIRGRRHGGKAFSIAPGTASLLQILECVYYYYYNTCIDRRCVRI